MTSEEKHREIPERRREPSVRRRYHDYLQTCLDNSPLAFIAWDESMRVLRWSERATQLLGWRSSETHDRLPGEWLFPQSECERFRELLRQVALEEPGSQAERFVTRAKDDREVPCTWHIQRDVEEPGTILAFVVAEGAPQHRVETLDFALGVARIGCWEWDFKRERIEWFGEMAQLFCFGPGEFRGTIEEAGRNVHPDDGALISKALSEAIAQKRDYSMDYRVIKPDGGIRWIRTVGRATYDSQGAPERMVGTASDITEKKKIETDLRSQKERAELSTAAKSTFLANMSHEIRAPLGIILGYSEMLGEPDLSAPERGEYASVVARNGEHLLRLVDDILDLSKIEAGKVEMRPVAVSLPALIGETVDGVRARASAKALSLVLDFSSTFSELVCIDPVRFKQILTNLVHNGVKYTDSGEIRVIVMRDSDSGRMRIRVQDTGIGISEDGQRSLFGAFARVDVCPKRKLQGTGLGLALSRKLARAMGGDVLLAYSKASEGSAFDFWLPKEIFNIDQCEIAVGKPRVTARASLNGVRVLLADDATDNQILIQRILKKRGAHVEIACDGEEACALALSGIFDIVLMDIQMPKLDGYQATRKLREDGFTGPIIALTAHAMKEERKNAIEAGCTEHLTKPIKQDDLVDTILRLIVSAKH